MTLHATFQFWTIDSIIGRVQKLAAHFFGKQQSEYTAEKPVMRWLVDRLDFTACQPLLGYFMPKTFCFIHSCWLDGWLVGFYDMSTLVGLF